MVSKLTRDQKCVLGVVVVRRVGNLGLKTVKIILLRNFEMVLKNILPEYHVETKTHTSRDNKLHLVFY